MAKTVAEMRTSNSMPVTAGDIVKRIKKGGKKKAAKAAGSSEKGQVVKKKRKKKRQVVDVVLKSNIPGSSVSIKNEGAVKKNPKNKANVQLGIVTRAGIRRCATRVGIRCIQRDTVDLLKDTVEEVAKELFARARSNAYNISRTKTLRLVDIASAARNMGLGDVVA